MKKILPVFLWLHLSFFTWPVFSANDVNDPAYDRAREDYRTYLKQLKALGEQYKEFKGGMEKIMQEEGFPTWDESTDSLSVAKLPTHFTEANVRETDKEMIVRLDMPGVKKNDIKVNIQDSRLLQVSGRRILETGETQAGPNTNFNRSEHQASGFERVVKLPSLASEDVPSAKYEDGVLTVRIKKGQNAKKEVPVPVQ